MGQDASWLMIAILLAYGASTATTVIPVLHALFYSPVPAKTVLSTMEIVNLLGTYVPFFLIPLFMAVDMSMRLMKIVNVAQTRKDI